MATLLEVQELEKRFVTDKSFLGKPTKVVNAVDKVSLHICSGETIGIVGESGCGKSTLGRTILGLLPPTGGKILYKGSNIVEYSARDTRELRKKMQLIFQDPYASLNPRMTVFELICAPLNAFGLGSRSERAQRVADIMEKVGLSPETMGRYPHEFSGGQRQRIVIARALVLQPEFVVCDEPVSALDVSVRAQVLNLLRALQSNFGLTYLFISHDLSVIKYVSSRVAVMYLGRIVEMAKKEELFGGTPLHPYTEALLSAIPLPDVEHQRSRIVLTGDVPSPIHPPSGCHFHPRCRYATERCRTEKPPLENCGGGHMVACHLHSQK